MLYHTVIYNTIPYKAINTCMHTGLGSGDIAIATYID